MNNFFIKTYIMSNYQIRLFYYLIEFIQHYLQGNTLSFGTFSCYAINIRSAYRYVKTIWFNYKITPRFVKYYFKIPSTADASGMREQRITVFGMILRPEVFPASQTHKTLF